MADDLTPTLSSAADGAAVVRDIMEQYATPQPVALSPGTAASGTALALPKGFSLHSLKPLLDEWRDRPRFRHGTAKLEDLSSFIAHANRFKDGDSALFLKADVLAKTPAPSLLSVLDYHEAREGRDNPDTAGPRFGRHRGRYDFPMSEEVRLWGQHDGEPMTQNEFASFLEERIQDVTPPPLALERATSHKGDSLTDTAAQAPSDRDQGGDFGPKTWDEQLAEMVTKVGGTIATPQRLMELSRGLSVHAEHKVTQNVNLSSGERNLTFSEEHTNEAGEPIKVPSLFLIAIPIFYSGPRYRMLVRLRYRLSHGKLLWLYQIYEPQRSIQHAIEEAARRAADETGLPLYWGQPEE